MSSGGLSVDWASGTTAFRRIELDRRQSLAVAAGALLLLWGYLSRFLPSLPDGVNSFVSAAITLTLIATIVYGLASLDRLGHGLLLVAAVILPFAMLMVAFGAVPLANLTKVALATILGLWIAQGMPARSWIIVFAVAASLSDIISLAVGPTRMMLTNSPEMIGGLTVALTWFGSRWSDSHTALGVSDIVFIALFLGAARRFHLRELPSVAAMVASILVTLLAAMWWKALPALPMLALYFMAVNVDLFVEKEATDMTDDAVPEPRLTLPEGAGSSESSG